MKLFTTYKNTEIWETSGGLFLEFGITGFYFDFLEDAEMFIDEMGVYEI